MQAKRLWRRDQALSQYLGSDGPRYTVHNLTVGQSKAHVVVFEVEPPQDGRIFYCHRTVTEVLTTSTGIKKNVPIVRDGAVYVRHDGSTEEAPFEELQDRIDRQTVAKATAVDLQIAVSGVAYRVNRDVDECNQRYITDGVASLHKDNPPQQLGTLNFPNSSVMAYMGDEPGRIDEWERERTNDWPERRLLLIGALGDGVRFNVSNSENAIPLVNPQIVVTLHSAQGVHWESDDDTTTADVFPYPRLPSMFERISQAGNLRHIAVKSTTLDWSNPDADTLECVLTPESIRAGRGWVSDADELVIIATDPDATELKVDWVATFHGILGKFEGSTKIPVVPLSFTNRPYSDRLPLALSPDASPPTTTSRVAKSTHPSSVPSGPPRTAG